MGLYKFLNNDFAFDYQAKLWFQSCRLTGILVTVILLVTPYTFCRYIQIKMHTEEKTNIISFHCGCRCISAFIFFENRLKIFKFLLIGQQLRIIMKPTTRSHERRALTLTRIDNTTDPN